MKQLFSLLLALTVTHAINAQNKPAPKTATKPTPAKSNTAAKIPPVVLKNAADSFSYALGLSVASFYKQQGIESINTTLLSRGINDTRTGKASMNDDEVNNTIINFMQGQKARAAEPAKKEGRAFLEANKTKEGVVTLPSGLQYKILKEGTGPKPGPNDRVKVHYQGSLLNGKIFDSSIQRGEPVQLGVSDVIAGWIEALQLMPTGSKWQLYIPSDLGYGDAGAGNDIPPGATLIFDVELLEIVSQ